MPAMMISTAPRPFIPAPMTSPLAPPVTRRQVEERRADDLTHGRQHDHGEQERQVGLEHAERHLEARGHEKHGGQKAYRDVADHRGEFVREPVLGNRLAQKEPPRENAPKMPCRPARCAISAKRSAVRSTSVALKARLVSPRRLKKRHRRG